MSVEAPLNPAINSEVAKVLGSPRGTQKQLFSPNRMVMWEFLKKLPNEQQFSSAGVASATKQKRSEAASFIHDLRRKGLIKRVDVLGKRYIYVKTSAFSEETILKERKYSRYMQYKESQPKSQPERLQKNKPIKASKGLLYEVSLDLGSFTIKDLTDLVETAMAEIIRRSE